MVMAQGPNGTHGGGVGRRAAMTAGGPSGVTELTPLPRELPVSGSAGFSSPGDVSRRRVSRPHVVTRPCTESSARHRSECPGAPPDPGWPLLPDGVLAGVRSVHFLLGTRTRRMLLGVSVRPWAACRPAGADHT